MYFYFIPWEIFTPVGDLSMDFERQQVSVIHKYIYRERDRQTDRLADFFIK